MAATHVISGSQGGLQPLTSSRIFNTHTSMEVPFILPDSGYIPPTYPPAELATPPNAPGELPAVSPPSLLFDRLPCPEPSPPSSAGLVSQSSGTGSTCNLFPSIAEVIREVNEQRPGLRLGNLELDLSLSGVTDSCQLLLVPEEVLSIAGNISLPQIRIIRNVARQMLLPRLGFRGTYNKPEFSEFKDENEGVVEGVDEDISKITSSFAFAFGRFWPLSLSQHFHNTLRPLCDSFLAFSSFYLFRNLDCAGQYMNVYIRRLICVHDDLHTY